MEQVVAESWQGSNLCFVLITVMVLVSAFGAAYARNIVNAAFCLFFTLLGMAGYYILLGSGFLAVTQVIIYVGGILVLLMFGILLTNRPFTKEMSDFHWRRTSASIVCTIFFLFVLVRIILSADWFEAEKVVEPEISIRILGSMLLNEYVLALELAGFLLLLSLIGAAYLVRREER
ncbi:NADH-quinone oxidoreductase subunit J [Oligoflexia bacterium]|nr:NADH-quinone oxidoreductase subunit J [Oligoflexia bacterium]